MKYFTCLWQGGLFVVEALEGSSETDLFEAAGYAELRDLLIEAGQSSNLKGVVLVVSAGSALARGFDLAKVGQAGCEPTPEALALLAQSTTSTLRSLRVPVVCAMEGPCHGAAFGLFLAGRYRVAVAEHGALFESTELKVGLIPFDGTTLLLSQVVGISRALDVLLSGRRIDLKMALEWGLVDASVEPGRLREEAIQVCWILSQNTEKRGNEEPRLRLGLRKLFEDNPMARAILRTKVMEHIESSIGPAFATPYAVADFLLGLSPRDEEQSLVQERGLFLQLITSNDHRALVHIRRLGLHVAGFPPSHVSSRGKRGASLRHPAVAVLGGGECGNGIAAELATEGIDVSVFVEEEREFEDSSHVLHSLIRKKIESGKLDDQGAESSYSRMNPIFDRQALRDYGCFVDGVSQTVRAAKLRYAAVRDAVGEGRPFSFFVTNPAVDLQALVCSLPGTDNLAGVYCSHPLMRRSFAEISVLSESSQATIDAALGLVRRLHKKPLVSRCLKAPLVSRLCSAYFLEALYTLGSGSSIDEIDFAMTRFGMHKGPFALMDDIGLDFLLPLLEGFSLRNAERFPFPNQYKDIVADGKLGRKSGSGFYRFEGGKRTGVDIAIYDYFGEPPPGASLRDKDIVERCLFAMVNEAMWALHEGQIHHVRDADFASVFALGFPVFRGGVAFFLEQWGWEQAFKRFSFLERHVGSRFSPAEPIRRLASSRSQR
jgi:3-hydroxyacyl-CoA dehydrogenase/enoyl-CoA hydratase/3-hydroxybutyryl-CoA epimerase